MKLSLLGDEELDRDRGRRLDVWINLFASRRTVPQPFWDLQAARVTLAYPAVSGFHEIHPPERIGPHLDAIFASVKKKKKKSQGRDRGMLLIAIFKLFKCALLLALGIGALTLLRKNVASALSDLLATLHVDHDNRYLHGLVARLGLADDRKLTAIGAGSFFYAALMGTEGVGLLLGKRWANYLTIVASALFIPLEIYELFKQFGLARLAILVVNIAVVAYLAYRLRAERKI